MVKQRGIGLKVFKRYMAITIKKRELKWAGGGGGRSKPYHKNQVIKRGGLAGGLGSRQGCHGRTGLFGQRPVGVLSYGR